MLSDKPNLKTRGFKLHMVQARDTRNGNFVKHLFFKFCSSPFKSRGRPVYFFFSDFRFWIDSLHLVFQDRGYPRSKVKKLQMKISTLM